MSDRGAKINKRVIEHDKLLYGALLGINVVVVVELVGISNLDTALNVAVHCFAASIPLLVLHILARTDESQHEYFPEPVGWYVYLFTFFSPFISLVGLGAFFYHFSPTVGVLFIGTSVYSLWALFTYGAALDKSNQASGENNQTSNPQGDA